MPALPKLPAGVALPTIGTSLAIIALAGAVDASGYLQYQRVFVSFMSGNTTSMGVAAATGAHAQLLRLTLVLGLFVMGVAAGTALHRAAKRHPAAIVLLVVAALLLLAYAWPAVGLFTLSLGMGMLNASVHQVGSATMSLTYVTGTLVKIGTGLADLLTGHPVAPDWTWQVLGWVCFVGGVLLGAGATLRLGPAALAGAGAWALVLAAWQWWQGRPGGSPHPLAPSPVERGN